MCGEFEGRRKKSSLSAVLDTSVGQLKRRAEGSTHRERHVVGSSRGGRKDSTAGSFGDAARAGVAVRKDRLDDSEPRGRRVEVGIRRLGSAVTRPDGIVSGQCLDGFFRKEQPDSQSLSSISQTKGPLNLTVAESIGLVDDRILRLAAGVALKVRSKDLAGVDVSTRFKTAAVSEKMVSKGSPFRSRWTNAKGAAIKVVDSRLKVANGDWSAQAL